MFLEKLEIQGFKSFANKNILIFPGMIDKTKRGITAIVGPNGSGKSNVADSVRWVLGEQSMKTLRGKKSEDVIFSGSDKKGKLGMAEVSLYLNNEDRKAPIEYSQIILTRRLYRDGESEYLINNNRARLFDIQIMLAKANFGQKTYSVIGQGMVEGFLNTSLSERKEFFDEATGVKQFQIKRDDSLNKLRLSYENLNQAQMLIDEIEPRLKSLTRQVNKLQKRGELESDIKDLQKKYYGKLWHDINDKYQEYNSQFLDIEKIKIKKEKELENYNKELALMEKNNSNGEYFNELQKKLSEKQHEKDIITKKIAIIEAQMEIKLENEGQFDLSWLNNRYGELNISLKKNEEEIEILNNYLKEEKIKILKLEEKKADINLKISEIEKEMNKSLSGSSSKDYKKINQDLKKLMQKLEDSESEGNIEKIKEIIKEIRLDLMNILKNTEFEANGEKIEQIQRDLLSLAKNKEKLLMEIHEININNSSKKEKKLLLDNYLKEIKNEIEITGAKLRKNQEKIGTEENIGELKNLKNNLDKIEINIKEIKEKISGFSKEEEEKRSKLFDMQRKIQNWQNEINNLNNNINDIKVNSTRYETKLEDLEVEIRHDFGDFKTIRDNKFNGKINVEEIREKIENIKKQLDLIGGIDPEVEKEYGETKVRFDFLSGQSNDLTNAIKSLEEIIKELDINIKEKFDKEFKVISEKFEEYFKILFNGGSAKIIKVMQSDLDAATKEEEMQANIQTENSNQEKRIKEKEDKYTENIKKIKYLQKYNATGLAGIEIHATPPGKKIKSIAMLSGGERALVAIALICAIISANPSPFVVLDEVDAALDEANSERLAKILDDLSHKTQFIVITHNRASMRRANILYGITMLEDGVSKLLSIKLDEVKIKN